MSRRALLALAAGVAGLVVALGAGVVLTAPDAALPWFVFGASGNTSSSTSYQLGSTSGQSSPIGESGSTNYELCAGFWCEVGPAGVPATPTPTPPPACLVGDVNMDGFVNSIDAALILQLNAGLIPGLPCQGAADVNLDGTINAIDAALILQYGAGLIGNLPP